VKITPILFNIYDRYAKFLIELEDDHLIAFYRNNFLKFFEYNSHNPETSQENQKSKFVSNEIFSQVRKPLRSLFREPETAFDFFPENEKLTLLFIDGKTDKILLRDKENSINLRELIRKAKHKYPFAIHYQKKICFFMEGRCENCRNRANVRVCDKTGKTYRLYCYKCIKGLTKSP
jgi:hypothetical protein